MLNWLRERLRSAEIRRQERINAYVDGELSDGERQQFEADLRDDAALQAEVATLQRLKAGVRALPRISAPRNFILDPAEFAKKPAPAYEARAYPLLRGATALAGLMFMLVLVFGLLSSGGMAPMAADSVAMEPLAVEESAEMAEAQTAEEAVEVQLTVVVEPAIEAAEEMMAEAEMVEEVVAEPELALEAEAGEAAADSATAADDAVDETADEDAADAAARSAEMLEQPTATQQPDVAADAEPTLQAKQASDAIADGDSFEFSATVDAEIQATDEIAEHDVIGTEIADPPLESVPETARPQRTVTQRLMTALGVLFGLLLAATWLIRRRLENF